MLQTQNVEYEIDTHPAFFAPYKYQFIALGDNVLGTLLLERPFVKRHVVTMVITVLLVNEIDKWKKLCVSDVNRSSNIRYNAGAFTNKTSRSSTYISTYRYHFHDMTRSSSTIIYPVVGIFCIIGAYCTRL